MPRIAAQRWKSGKENQGGRFPALIRFSERNSARNFRGGLNCLQYGQLALPRLIVRGDVCWNGVRGVFAHAHKSVARAVVCDGIIFLVCGLHGLGCGGEKGVKARGGAATKKK